MLRHVIAALVAIAALVVVIAVYYFVWIIVCPLEGPRLAASLVLLSLSIYLFLHSRGVATCLLLVGSVGLAGAHFHDYFIAFGIEHGLFELAGSDTYVMQGYFEPRENPLIAVPADVLRFTGLFAIVGIVWLTVQVTRKLLNHRWSQPAAMG
jgi:hypothetical protein